MIAFNQVRFDSILVFGKRVVVATSAVTAMRLSGRVLPCIAKPEGYQIVHTYLISSAFLQRRKQRKGHTTDKVPLMKERRELLQELRNAF